MIRHLIQTHSTASQYAGYRVHSSTRLRIFKARWLVFFYWLAFIGLCVSSVWIIVGWLT